MKKSILICVLLSLGGIAFADDSNPTSVNGTKEDSQLSKTKSIYSQGPKTLEYKENTPGTQEMIQALQILKNNPKDIETQEEAFKLLKDAADKGNFVAQREIGNWYLHGFGTKANYEKAIEYFSKAIEQGDPQSMIALGVYYVNGTGGIPKNFETANIYFRKAAEIDKNKRLYTYIGNIFLKSNSDMGGTFALPWLQKGAEAGDSTAQYLLSYCYIQGIGTPKNIQDGLSELQQAGDSLNPLALADMALIFEKGLFEQKENPKYAYLLYTLSLTGTPVSAEGQERTGKRLSKTEINKITKWIDQIYTGKPLSDIVKFKYNKPE